MESYGQETVASKKLAAFCLKISCRCLFQEDKKQTQNTTNNLIENETVK